MFNLNFLNFIKSFFLIFLNKYIKLKEDFDIHFNYNSYKNYNLYGHVSCDFINQCYRKSIYINSKKFLIKIDNYFKKKLFIDKIIIKNNFINFFISFKTILFFLENKKKKDFVSSINNKYNNIVIEYGSINPNGKLHLGHFRNLLYGNILSNIYNFFDIKIQTHFLVNDEGVQMNELFKKIVNIHSDYLNNNNLDNHLFDKNILYLYENVLKKNINNFKIKIINFFINEFKSNLCKMNFLQFDKFIYESDLRKDKKLVSDFFTLFKKHFYKDEAKIFFVLDDKIKKCILREDNTFTYFTSDCLYMLYKFNNNVDKNIIILGMDHDDYVSNLKKLNNFYIKKFQFNQLLSFWKYQLILFKNQRLSKRNKTIFNIPIDNEILLTNIKWFIINFNTKKHIKINDEQIHKLFDFHGFILKYIDQNKYLNLFNIDLHFFKHNIISRIFKKKKILKKNLNILIFIISIINQFNIICNKIIKNHNNFFLLILLLNEIILFYKTNSYLFDEKYQNQIRKKSNMSYLLELLLCLNYIFISICKILTLIK